VERAVTEREQLISVLDGLEREGTTVMDLVRAGQPAEAWRLYPGEEGIFDRGTRCQFYYHAHDDDRDEDGHFHTVRLFNDRTVHLVGISMARTGWPRALFTVNRWVTGDAYETVAQIKGYVRRFHVDQARGPAPLVRFVNLMFRVFLRDIERLQEDKVATLAAHRLRYPERDPFQDRSLEILSWTAVDLRQDSADIASSPSRPPYSTAG
jgi:hypothetical protein